MKVVCISDTHNKHYELKIPDGDVIVHTGDFTNKGTFQEVKCFIDWFVNLDFEYKILIAGNHEVTLDDKFYEKNWKSFHKIKQDTVKIKNLILNSGIIYLEDSSVNIKGVNFYGSPYTLVGDVLWGFQLHNYSESIAKWSLIPADTDVLLTHCPPNGYMDGYRYNNYGCNVLLLHVKDRVKPAYHIFGHVHEQHGTVIEHGITFVNAEVVDGKHFVVYDPVILDFV
jgi:Icc-related predicted phosphoesterase